MAVLLVVLSIFTCGGIIHLLINRECERHYQRELQYWAEFQRSIVQERLEMAHQWAAYDLKIIARGGIPQGCPRGTPIQTFTEYERIMDAESQPVAVPVEMPAWQVS